MFQRKKITVPAAGVIQRFDLGGLAVVVSSMNLYLTVDDTPKLIFDSENNSTQPLFPQSVYTGNQGSIFSSFFIQGTDASAGDTVDLLISDDCMNQEINPVLASVSDIQPIDTFEKSATDSIITISDLEITNSQGLLAKNVFVMPKGDDMRWSIGSDPVSGGFGYFWPENKELRVEGLAFIRKFKAINDTAATQLTISITPEV